MTGYQSKKAAAQDKLAQPEQEALNLALEALKEIARYATTPWEDEWCGELANETLTAINALAQPPQRTWVDMTDDELADIWYKESLDWMEFARAVLAKSKEKNNG